MLEVVAAAGAAATAAEDVSATLVVGEAVLSSGVETAADEVVLVSSTEEDVVAVSASETEAVVVGEEEDVVGVMESTWEEVVGVSEELVEVGEVEEEVVSSVVDDVVEGEGDSVEVEVTLAIVTCSEAVVDSVVDVATCSEVLVLVGVGVDEEEEEEEEEVSSINAAMGSADETAEVMDSRIEAGERGAKRKIEQSQFLRQTER